MLAFLIKACVAALKKFPEFNASLDGDQLVLKQYFHIGFAADTPNGLVVPVIKDADKKGVLQISQEMGELARKARDGKLSPAEMSGAQLHHLFARRHRRALLHAHHQRAGSGYPGRLQKPDRAGVGRQAVPAPADAAAVAVVGPPRDRRRGGCPFQRLPGARSWRTSAARCYERSSRNEPGAFYDNGCGGEESGADRHRGGYPGDLRRHAPGQPVRGQHQDLQGRDRWRAELHRHGRHRGALSGAAQGHGLDAARDPQARQHATRCSTRSPSCIPT